MPCYCSSAISSQWLLHLSVAEVADVQLSVVAVGSGCRLAAFSVPCSCVRCVCRPAVTITSELVHENELVHEDPLASPPRGSAESLSPGIGNEGSSVRCALLTVECCH